MSLVRGSSASQSQPCHAVTAAQAGTDLIKLRMRQVEAVQEVAMYPLGVLGGAVPPTGNRRLTMGEHTHGSVDVQPFSQGAQHFADARGWRFELVERSAPAGRDLAATSLALEILNAVTLTMVTIGDERVDPRIADAVVLAAGIAAGVAVGRDAARCSVAATTSVHM